MEKKIKVASLCQLCHGRRAVVKRPKNLQRLCKECFFTVFETEIHNTIVTAQLFQPGERVAIGASGGKDSTVLASVLKTLNERYNYGLDLVLLSVDEGIKGYRDDSLATVKRNQAQYEMPLEIVSYKELYDWLMDEIVACAGIRSSCTYCGVLRRQALDRGAAKLGIQHVVTGHNADDMAETVLMNLLRGDTARLELLCALLTHLEGSPVRRSKPFKYMYQKEIVLYAHYKRLDYFSTECTYAPEAFRGTARELLKGLGAVRPSVVMDIIHSGEQFVLKKKEIRGNKKKGKKGKTENTKDTAEAEKSEKTATRDNTVPPRKERGAVNSDGSVSLGNTCERCGYITSNRICKACLLLAGLEASRPKMAVELEEGAAKVVRALELLSF